MLKNLSWSVALPPIRFIYGFTLAAMLSKNLSVTDYGDWSLFIANIGLVLTFSSLNLMYASSIRLTGKPPEEQSADIFRVGLFKLAMTLVVFAGFGFYLHYGQVLSLQLIWLMLAALFFRAITDMTFGFLRALLQLRRQVLILLAESVLILIGVSIGSIFLDGGLTGAASGFVLAEIVSAMIGLYLLRAHIRKATWQWGTIWEYLTIGLPLIPFSFSDLIVNALVPLLIKVQSSSEAVAFYSIAQKVAMIATIPNSIVNNVYAQYLKRSFLEGGGRGVRKRIGQFLMLYLGMAIPVTGLLYFFGGRIILIVSTSEYLGTQRLMILLVTVYVIIMLTAMFTTIFAVYDRTREVGFLWIAILGIFVAMAWYAIPQYGTIGVAWALIAAFGLGLVLVAIGGIRLTYKPDISQPPKIRSNS